GLVSFHGAEGRFQQRGRVNGIAVVDDYGHHPTEIAAVMAAAKPMTTGRLIVAFQPHRFTRTQSLLNEFGRSFAGADTVLLTDIYSAGEDPIPGVTVEALATAIGRTYGGDLRVVTAVNDVPRELARIARSGDLIVILGAGSIGSISQHVLDELQRAARA